MATNQDKGKNKGKGETGEGSTNKELPEASSSRGSSSNPNTDDSSTVRQNTETPSTTLLPVYGYIGAPATIDIHHYGSPGLVVLNSVVKINAPIQFLTPELNLKPMMDLLVEIRKKMLTRDDIDELSTKIGNELVGESYYRWNSRVDFYPTLVFIFVEEENKFQLRKQNDRFAVQKKTQIKLRVTECELVDLSDSRIEALTSSLIRRVQAIENYIYKTGPTKFTYISSGKAQWKTTIFAFNRTQACNLLTVLCKIIKEEFLDKNLSTTFPRSSSEDNLKQANLKTNVKLLKVSLLLKTLGKQTIIFHS